MGGWRRNRAQTLEDPLLQRAKIQEEKEKKTKQKSKTKRRKEKWIRPSPKKKMGQKKWKDRGRSSSSSKNSGESWPQVGPKSTKNVDLLSVMRSSFHLWSAVAFYFVWKLANCASLLNKLITSVSWIHHRHLFVVSGCSSNLVCWVGMKKGRWRKPCRRKGNRLSSINQSMNGRAPRIR